MSCEYRFAVSARLDDGMVCIGLRDEPAGSARSRRCACSWTPRERASWPASWRRSPLRRRALPSWAGAMIVVEATRRRRVQLRLDLAESPAPAAALWELVGESDRHAAMALLAALIAQTIAGAEEIDGE